MYGSVVVLDQAEVCCCSKVLSMAHLRHYLFMGLTIQSRDGCIGEIFARWQYILWVEFLQQLLKSRLFC